MVYDVIIVGGGASGFFTAINYAERNPNKKIVIIERSREVLSKVRISGGGRCNLTHADFVPASLVKNYPRGEKELLSPFHHFMTGDVMEWFKKRNVPLKIEEDGRVFPQSDSSQSIIECFLNEIQKLGVELHTQQNVKEIYKEDQNWVLITSQTTYYARNIVIATGSNPKMWEILSKLGHQIVSPVPSLFTFNCKDKNLHKLAGIALNIQAELIDHNQKPLKENRERADKGGLSGNLLITHWGFSGPVILKLSAVTARLLNHLDYTFYLRVNWLPTFSLEELKSILSELKNTHSRKKVINTPLLEIPKNLWLYLVKKANIKEDKNWGDIRKKQIVSLENQISQSVFKIEGKSTFKEEFVTAGGVSLKEINFKTFESKIHKNLYIIGEALNIDAVTGGFNFQNAWTGAYIAACSLS